jgi:hypothetical protein
MFPPGKLILAVLAALALLVLGTGTASAAADPVTTTVDCVVGMLGGGCPAVEGAPKASAPDPVADTAAGAVPASLPASVPAGLPAGAPGGLPAGVPGGEEPKTVSEPAGTASGSGAGAAGGLVATACARFPQLPVIPGVGDLTGVTCDQLPGAVCPQLLAHPEVPGLSTLATTLLCAAPAPTATNPPVQPAGTYFANCDDARARGAAPVYAGQPGYRPALDSDNDGIGCEDPSSTGVVAVPVSAATPPVAVAGRTGQLAYTGVELAPLLATAAALLALGSGLLLTARRSS